MTTASSSPNLRSVSITRDAPGSFTATNARGGTVSFGSGDDERFTPVELLLAAIGGCSSIDVDIFTTRRAEPDRFEVTVAGEKLRDEEGNHMGPISVTFDLQFPEGGDGDRAREVAPDAIRRSHDRLCTVSRTVELSAPVRMEQL